MDCPGPLWLLRGCGCCGGDVTWDPLMEAYVCLLCAREVQRVRDVVKVRDVREVSNVA